MGDRTCSVDDCTGSPVARGWCGKHYQRWVKSGGPAPASRSEKTPAERFWPKVDADGDCWVWTAGRTADGYGRFQLGHGVRVLSHRWSYEELVGPIPAGLQLDHLCKNEPCVNPDHLEPVTGRENGRRSSAGWNSRMKTHCPKGHPYDAANTIRAGSRRACRACRRSPQPSTC